MKQITAIQHIVVGVTATLLISALPGCSARRAAAAPAGAAEPIAVTVAEVAMTDVARPIDSGGVVQARTTATITARILALVREVRVSPGDQVRKGQTLIVLDGEDLAAVGGGGKEMAIVA
jgi:multidrug efflux pump subunit AcrA (membrane-fusion protein)